MEQHRTRCEATGDALFADSDCECHLRGRGAGKALPKGEQLDKDARREPPVSFHKELCGHCDCPSSLHNAAYLLKVANVCSGATCGRRMSSLT